MYDMDVVFIDTVCPAPYEMDSLWRGAIGGTESTVIRIAEGLGQLGLRAAVLQHNRVVESVGRHAFYLPYDTPVNPKRVIHLRSIRSLPRFDNVRQWVWMHDDPDDRIVPWDGVLDDFKAGIIACSDWQGQELRKHLATAPITRIYNPVDSRVETNTFPKDKFTPDSFVWLSSPHKGLDECIRVFKEIQKQRPNAVLRIFNPGYLKDDFVSQPGIVHFGSVQSEVLWRYTANSAAILYPSHFRECCPLIALEAQYLGTPMLCYANAGFIETVGNEFCKDESDMIQKALEWGKLRPSVIAKPQFKLANILQDWVKLLKASR